MQTTEVKKVIELELPPLVKVKITFVILVLKTYTKFLGGM